MFACGKTPRRTFAGGRFTSVQFATCEDCRSIFPCETEMSVGPSRVSTVYNANTGKVRDLKMGSQVSALGSYNISLGSIESLLKLSPMSS